MVIHLLQPFQLLCRNSEVAEWSQFNFPFLHSKPTIRLRLARINIIFLLFVFVCAVEGGDDPNGFAPSFVEKPRIIPNDAGTLITMKCRCKSKPAPVVTWYREKDVVQESSRIKINSSSTEEDIYELVLEIKVGDWNRSSLIFWPLHSITIHSNAKN